MINGIIILVLIAINVILAIIIREQYRINKKLIGDIDKVKIETHNRTKGTRFGMQIEKLVPMMKDIQYNPQDMRFIGTPIDYIIFDGLDEGNLKQIVLLEVKSGTARLTQREKDIQTICDSAKIKHEIIRIPIDANN